MKSEPPREEALFQAAAQLSGIERASFLNGACYGDAALRQSLDALLAVHDQSEGLPAIAAPRAGSPSGPLPILTPSQRKTFPGLARTCWACLDHLFVFLLLLWFNAVVQPANTQYRNDPDHSALLDGHIGLQGAGCFSLWLMRFHCLK